MKTCKLAAKLAVIAAALSLAACATTGTRDQAYASKDAVDSVDYEKMALVNHVARQKGVEVVWINPPHRNDAD